MWQHIYWRKREKKQDSKSYLDSKSTIFEVINSFKLYDRVCTVSILRTEEHNTPTVKPCKLPTLHVIRVRCKGWNCWWDTVTALTQVFTCSGSRNLILFTCSLVAESLKGRNGIPVMVVAGRHEERGQPAGEMNHWRPHSPQMPAVCSAAAQLHCRRAWMARMERAHVAVAFVTSAHRQQLGAHPPTYLPHQTFNRLGGYKRI
jgi:hypothetical protein